MQLPASQHSSHGSATGRRCYHRSEARGHAPVFSGARSRSSSSEYRGRSDAWVNAREDPIRPVVHSSPARDISCSGREPLGQRGSDVRYSPQFVQSAERDHALDGGSFASQLTTSCRMCALRRAAKEAPAHGTARVPGLSSDGLDRANTFGASYRTQILLQGGRSDEPGREQFGLNGPTGRAASGSGFSLAASK